MDITVSEEEIRDIIKEQFDMEEFADIMSDDSGWLNDVLAREVVKRIKINRKELVEACVHEFYRECEIRWHDLEQEVYDEVSKKLADKILGKVDFEIKMKEKE